MKKIQVTDIRTKGWQDYALLDSGNQMKLEKFGTHKLARFEPIANWQPVLNKSDWDEAIARFSLKKTGEAGQWTFPKVGPRDWQIAFQNAQLNLHIRKSQHIGIFPEQHEQWQWIESKIRSRKNNPKVLNLFAYSGVATVFALRAGGNVTHVEASRSAIKAAKENAKLNQVENNPCRWIQDDVMKFVAKEIRRGVVYDAIILDPPLFGRGPKGEVWKFSRDFYPLLNHISKLFTKNPLFLLCTVYNIDQPIQKIVEIIQPKTIFDQGILQFGRLIQMELSGGREIEQAAYFSWSTS